VYNIPASHHDDVPQSKLIKLKFKVNVIENVVRVSQTEVKIPPKSIKQQPDIYFLFLERRQA
jgi:hypothetical protein